MKRFFLIWTLPVLLLACFLPGTVMREVLCTADMKAPPCIRPEEPAALPRGEPQRIWLPVEALMEPGTWAQLEPELSSSVASGVTYNVSDESILQVNADGKVTALSSGIATVTAHLRNGSSATQTVRVLELVDTLSLHTQRVKVKIDGSKPLKARVSPETAEEKLIWSSSDPTVARVDENGVVTGVGYGTAVITCTSEYGRVEASCKVKVCDLVQVALTFDDGPSLQYTGKMLELLKKYDIRATFFLLGTRIQGCEHHLQRMVADGHEIGYHSWTHKSFFRTSREKIVEEYERFVKTIDAVCGGKVTVFRGPGGGITRAALESIPLPHIHWNEGTRDWESRNTDKVKNAILDSLTDGGIILLHDIHGTTYTGTMAALEYIFANDLDVEFMTVTELLSRNGTPPQPGTTYYKG